MLTLKSIKGALPIAKIKGGTLDKKKLSIVPEHFVEQMQLKGDEQNPEDFMSLKELKSLLGIIGKKRLTGFDLKEFIKAFKEDDERFKEKKEDLMKKMKKNIIIHDGIFRPLPKENGVQRIFICAPSEAGKSYWCAQYMKEYKKMYPKNHIILFSDVKKDPLVDKLKPIRIPLDNDLIDDPVQPEEFNNSLVLFDDIDAIPNRKLFKVVNGLRDSMLTRGRHEMKTVLCTSHEPCDGVTTKVMLRECTHYVIFPRSGKGMYLYLLKKKLYFNAQQIRRIFSLPSRWVMICKTYPMHVIYEGGAYIL